MSNRRELTPAQRKAKNERDRRRREEHAMEFKRLKDEVRHLREANERLNQENERLNQMLSNSNIPDQLRGLNLELHEHHQGIEEYMKMAISRFDDKCSIPNEEVANNEPNITGCSGSSQSATHYAELVEDYLKKLVAKGKSKVQDSYEMSEVESWLLDKSQSPSPNEELANNEHITHCLGSSQSDIQYAEELANNEHITHCLGSSQSDIQYADELVEDFIKKLDAKEKSKVDVSDFDGLKEEMETSGINSLPPSLASFDAKIKEKFGEIDADSTQSSYAGMPSRILFCAAIREMNYLQLEEIDEKKLLLWRDAINSALNINFKVEFAIMHLKKIAHAYFGLKAWNELLNDPELMSITKRISELEIEYHALKAKYAQKVEARNSEMKKKCLHDKEFFERKSLSTGLF